MYHYTVNELDLRDLKEALTLVWNVFLEFEAPDYCKEGIREFKEFLEYETIRDKIIKSQLNMWTCKDNDIVIGVLAVRPPCHISLLFVDKNHHRKGIARTMFQELVKYDKSGGACSEITVNSSPYAAEVYHRLGFEDIDVEQTVNGIRFIPMKRSLCDIS